MQGSFDVGLLNRQLENLESKHLEKDTFSLYAKRYYKDKRGKCGLKKMTTILLGGCDGKINWKNG